MQRRPLLVAGVVAVISALLGIWFVARRSGQLAQPDSNVVEADFSARFADYEPAQERASRSSGL